MLKLFYGLYLAQLFLSVSCNTGSNLNMETGNMPVIIFNGDTIHAETSARKDFTDTVLSELSLCDDLYELIVTPDVIESIRTEGQYIEIIFPERITMQAGKSEWMIDRILVPMIGKFAANGQATFFTGNGDYSNTPVIKSKGAAVISRALEKIIHS